MLAFVDYKGLAALSSVSKEIQKLATADRVWEGEIARVAPEAEYIRTSKLTGMKLFRRMMCVWDHGIAETGGPWDAPGVESYAVIAIVEFLANETSKAFIRPGLLQTGRDLQCLARGRFPIIEDGDNFRVDVSSSILLRDGWEVNVTSLVISAALVRLADDKILHICSNSAFSDCGGDEHETYILLEGGTSGLTTMCCGVAGGVQLDSDLYPTNSYNVCLEQCRTTINEDERHVLTGFEQISIIAWDPMNNDSQVSCRQLLEAWHTSNKWM